MIRTAKLVTILVPFGDFSQSEMRTNRMDPMAVIKHSVLHLIPKPSKLQGQSSLPA